MKIKRVFLLTIMILMIACAWPGGTRPCFASEKTGGFNPEWKKLCYNDYLGYNVRSAFHFRKMVDNFEFIEWLAGRKSMLEHWPEGLNYFRSRPKFFQTLKRHLTKNDLHPIFASYLFYDLPKFDIVVAGAIKNLIKMKNHSVLTADILECALPIIINRPYAVKLLKKIIANRPASYLKISYLLRNRPYWSELNKLAWQELSKKQNINNNDSVFFELSSLDFWNDLDYFDFLHLMLRHNRRQCLFKMAENKCARYIFMWYDVLKAKNLPYFQPLIEKAAGTLAKKKLTNFFFYYFHLFWDKPYALNLLRTALQNAENTDEISYIFHCFTDINSPYLKKSLYLLAEVAPGKLLNIWQKLTFLPYFRNLLEITAKKASQQGKIQAVKYGLLYKNEPYFREVITTAVNNIVNKIVTAKGNYGDFEYYDYNMTKLLDLAYIFQDLPNGPALLKKIIRVNYSQAMKNATIFSVDKLSREPDADIKIFCRIFTYNDFPLVNLPRQNPYNAIVATQQKMLALMDDIYRGQLTLPRAKAITADPVLFLQKLMDIRCRADHLARPLVDSCLKEMALRLIHRINRLHNKPNSVRFRSVAEASAKELYFLIVYGKEEAYTSTYNGLFNRILRRLKARGLSGGQLLTAVHYVRFRDFINLSIGYNRINEWLATMSKRTGMALMQKFAAGLETAPDSKLQAIIVADAFATLRDKKILAIVQRTVKSEYERVKTAGHKKGIALYGLLAGLFGQRAIINEAWFRAMAQKYRLPDLMRIRCEELAPNGKLWQAYYFYNDEDGQLSFQSFLRQYRHQPHWRITRRKKYVKIESRNTKIKIVILANLPSAGSDGRATVDYLLKKIKPVIVAHRGHSYYLEYTITYHLPKSAKIIFIGSCGGYNNIRTILDKAPEAQIIATKGQGTMYVNDPLLKTLNEQIARGRDIFWPAFWRRFKKQHSANAKQINDYIPPYRNLSVLFLRTYNKIYKDS